MFRYLFTCFLFVTPVLAQQQPDPKYLVGPLQSQRDQAANQAALCGAENVKLQEEIAGLKAKLAELDASTKKDAPK